MKRLGIYLGRHRGHGGGIGQYASSLVSGLASIKEELPGIEVSIYADDNFLKSSKLVVDQSFKLKKLPNIFGGRLDWVLDQILFPLKAFSDKQELIHSVSNQGFLFWRGKQIITVHDLFQAYPPGEPSGFVNKCYQLLFKLQFLSKSSKYITDISEVKDLIIDKYNIKKDRVSKISIGLDKDFLNYQAKPVEAAEGYVFLIGGFGTRKNVERALEAWKMLGRDQQSRGLVVLLSDERVEPIVREKLGDNPNVSIVRNLDREAMIDYYSSAKVVLNPTLAEGFGLPVLEGLAVGASVVSGPIDWVKEREGVFVCDPKNTEDISRCLSAALNHQSSNAEKNSFRSYQDMARDTVEVYRSVGEFK